MNPLPLARLVIQSFSIAQPVHPLTAPCALKTSITALLRTSQASPQRCVHSSSAQYIMDLTLLPKHNARSARYRSVDNALSIVGVKNAYRAIKGIIMMRRTVNARSKKAC
jgi:hypothetical protein